MSAGSPAYVELDAMTAFSFLEGGSHPHEMVVQAMAVGHAALGVADRNTLAGVVRAHVEAKKHGFKLLVGCRLVFRDGAALIVYPRDRAAYGRLCRLLSLGKSRIEASEAPSSSLSQTGRGTADRGGGAARDARKTQPPPFARLRRAPPPALRAHSPIADGGDDCVPDTERIPNTETHLTFEDAVALGQGWIALACAPDALDAAFVERLSHWREAWPDALYLAARLLHRGDDRARLAQLAAIADRTGAPLVATNAALYHHPDRRRLQDVLTCIREKTTIDAAGHRLQAHAERHLKPPAEMARLFRGHAAALTRTVEIADACAFNLDELSYHYPNEPAPPGKTADRHLRNLVFQGARARLGPDLSAPIVATIVKELRLIRQLKYPHYFLTVHDVVAEARRRGILCQGRGSAANSVVCFCLGITNVNPTEQDLLFERFLSAERGEPPDIDVDFEHERREEVIQYVYGRYGRHRAAIVATVIHYRPRSAIREVGKALGLSEDVTSALAGTVWGSWGEDVPDEHVKGAGFEGADQRLPLALALTRELIGLPRHLSQHVGGFVLTEGPLVEMVPVANAAMAERTFIEWDKDDIDALNIMKVDVLALGMLTAIRKAFDLIAAHKGERWELHTLPREQPEVYDMLCGADSLGVFQVESRAQMAMLPRLRPRSLYDLAVQVAIVRPGPIQGGMVHPYLKARTDRRVAEREGRPFAIDFPKPGPDHDPDELKRVLRKTLGVPIFQEQAMRIAMVAACFSGDEANGLRRAMATFRHMGTIGEYEAKMVGRMIARGYDPDFARHCFSQIKGFGEYGFPESHAAAFAHLVYVSAWIKCVHPEVFACALLNSQPMGFYAPAQIVRDAQAHGVEVRHPDVNRSGWDNTLETPSAAMGERMHALRLGLRQIGGFREGWAEAIAAARPVASLDALRRAGLPARALELLAEADALGSLALGRRPGLWAARGLPAAAPAPLFAACGLDEADALAVALPAMAPAEAVVSDHEALRLSLKAHPVSFLRGGLARAGVRPCAWVDAARPYATGEIAGVVLVRQRPGSAKGVCFITLEDETGIANLVVWPKTFEAYRPVIMSARMLLARGRVERASAEDGGVVHFIVAGLQDRTADLLSLADRPMPSHLAPGDAGGARGAHPAAVPPPERGQHPRDRRILPRSRDFH
jgi:error-prone DNA polymerase